MGGFSAVLGQTGAAAILQSALESGRIAHAYLFAGPRGVGKGLTAEVFARALNCAAHEDRPCDRCLPCQKALNGNHPDILWLKPAGSSFKIEQVRELQRTVHAKVYEGRHKVIVLEDSHKATTQAANSLLKTLEEPPGSTVFILLSENPQTLPPTILSRCQRVNFAPLDNRLISEVLRQRQLGRAEDRELAVSLAGGSLGRAIEYMQDQKVFVLRQRAIEFIQACLGKNYYRRYKITESLEKDKLDVALFFEHMLLLLRDVYLGRNGQGQGRAGIPEALEQTGLDAESIGLALQVVLDGVELQRKQANTKLLLDVIGCRLARLA